MPETFDRQVEVRNDIHTVAINWFTNRCPLVTRIPRVPIGATTFTLINRATPEIKEDGSGCVSKPTGVTQFCQIWQQPVQVEAASADSAQQLAMAAPFSQVKMTALEALMNDMEVSSYYGRGVVPSYTVRPGQKGLRTILTTHNVTTPDNAANYTPTDLIRDTLEACRKTGGDPDVLLVASDVITGFATWGQTAQQIDAGSTVFGTPIDVFEVPFLGGVSVIEAPLLKPGTVIALTSSEVRMRMKRNEFWNPRGSRGDAFAGDWMAEGAIEIDNESHHAWVEGIKAFTNPHAEPEA